jgi:glutathione synthase/RimK-type ligase-like ATP-grasp enzyme
MPSLAGPLAAKGTIMIDIYVLTAYDGFFGQTRKPWVSLDTALLIKELQQLGYRVHQHEFHELMNGLVKPQNSIIFYTFSHRLNLRHYIRDCLLYLKAGGNTLIPSFELFSCHENKGWQELLKNTLEVHSLDCLYFSSKRELEHYQFSFPKVFKTLTGSCSTGVALVNSKADIYRELKRHEPKLRMAQKLDFWRRKHLRKHKKFAGYPGYDLLKDAHSYQDYMTPELPFVLQQFVPSLSYDYRVVILGDKYFISKRLNRAGDFRASGGKKFDFKVPKPEPMLDKARALYDSFNAPFLSIDLGEDAEGKLYLFEYQASHFGMFTILNSKGYYQKVQGKWQFTEAKAVFERYLAEGLDLYLKR